jgi:hypothetical protein
MGQGTLQRGLLLLLGWLLGGNALWEDSGLAVYILGDADSEDGSACCTTLRQSHLCAVLPCSFIMGKCFAVEISDRGYE